MGYVYTPKIITGHHQDPASTVTFAFEQIRR